MDWLGTILSISVLLRVTLVAGILVLTDGSSDINILQKASVGACEDGTMASGH